MVDTLILCVCMTKCWNIKNYLVSLKYVLQSRGWWGPRRAPVPIWPVVPWASQWPTLESPREWVSAVVSVSALAWASVPCNFRLLRDENDVYSSLRLRCTSSRGGLSSKNISAHPNASISRPSFISHPRRYVSSFYHFFLLFYIYIYICDACVGRKIIKAVRLISGLARRWLRRLLV